MAGIVAGGGIQLGTAAKNLGRRRAAGIYGAIITAAILDTAGGHLPTAALVVSVVVTLLVYWLAEEYAELVGEQVQGGRLPGREHILGALAATWPMVSASFLPLLALVLARLAVRGLRGRGELRAADRPDRAVAARPHRTGACGKARRAARQHRRGSGGRRSQCLDCHGISAGHFRPPNPLGEGNGRT